MVIADKDALERSTLALLRHDTNTAPEVDWWAERRMRFSDWTEGVRLAIDAFFEAAGVRISLMRTKDGELVDPEVKAEVVLTADDQLISIEFATHHTSWKPTICIEHQEEGFVAYVYGADTEEPVAKHIFGHDGTYRNESE